MGLPIGCRGGIEELYYVKYLGKYLKTCMYLLLLFTLHHSLLFIKLDTHNRYVNQSYILTKSDYNVYPRKPRDTQIQQDHSFINALKGVLLREHAENETSFSCTV